MLKAPRTILPCWACWHGWKYHKLGHCIIILCGCKQWTSREEWKIKEYDNA